MDEILEYQLQKTSFLFIWNEMSEEKSKICFTCQFYDEIDKVIKKTKMCNLKNLLKREVAFSTWGRKKRVKRELRKLV